MKEIRCVVCRNEFDEHELIETAKDGCPVCGYKGLTMFTNGDLTININWFELRLICMWAESLALELADVHSLNAFYSIVKAIKKQLPEAGKITMFNEPPSVKGDSFLDDSLPPEGTILN